MVFSVVFLLRFFVFRFLDILTSEGYGSRVRSRLALILGLLLFLLLSLGGLYSSLLSIFLIAVLNSRNGVFAFFEESFSFDASEAVFDVLDSASTRFEEFGSSFLVDLETVNFGFVEVDLGRKDHSLGVMFQENMGEGGAEVGAVDIDAAEFGKVHLLATRTENLKP